MVYKQKLKQWKIQIKNLQKTEGFLSKLEQEIIYRFKFPKLVKSKQSKQFASSMLKSVLGANEKLEIEVWKLKGNRKIHLGYN